MGPNRPILVQIWAFWAHIVHNFVQEKNIFLRKEKSFLERIFSFLEEFLSFRARIIFISSSLIFLSKEKSTVFGWKFFLFGLNVNVKWLGVTPPNPAQYGPYGP